MASFNVFLLVLLAVMGLVANTFGRIYPLEVQHKRRPVKHYNNAEAGRVKRHHYGHGSGGGGITGPVHTFVKTDKHANFKWGVRHHVGQKYA